MSHIDECITLAPCHNGGTCENLDGFYSCNCPQGWSGQNCSQDINECSSSNFCENRGLCYNLIGTFRCICSAGWNGTNCEN
ncbi:FAT4-like protein, partial [Mya arenaria]